MYPFKFKPIYKEIMWGGDNLRKFGKDLPAGKKIAESWEISVRDGDQSIIDNGVFEGERLLDIISKYKKDIIGRSLPALYIENFPLLIKLIDANKDLSIQVHPTNEYANRIESQRFGKDETWVVIDRKKGSKLVYGTKEYIDKTELVKIIEKGELECHLNYVEVEPGDVFNVYPGLIHGIGEGIVVIEVQQNSNTTYRVYDYNRKDSDGNLRQLQINKAIDVIETKKKYPFDKIPGEKTVSNKNTLSTYVVKEQYVLQSLHIEEVFFDDTKEKRFFVYFVVSGEASIFYGNEQMLLKKGDTILIPACMGGYYIKGRCDLIRTFLLDPEELLIEVSLNSSAKAAF